MNGVTIPPNKNKEINKEEKKQNLKYTHAIPSNGLNAPIVELKIRLINLNTPPIILVTAESTIYYFIIFYLYKFYYFIVYYLIKY